MKNLATLFALRLFLAESRCGNLRRLRNRKFWQSFGVVSLLPALRVVTLNSSPGSTLFCPRTASALIKIVMDFPVEQFGGQAN